ncbi:MAG: undecaprenyldiphospho-muramoylpentapeptide beta-N-acetylglucosaminyltransferase [Saprospiraceae bacterium]|nr:undecaprenyldiphospho-muramoylpentapeptide beta-N-acetylglucosaminyltransferase [Saprospiraceae bacterium]MDW8229793.1 undecaprenyldiphospho-muramoylpentapeptide beta-N-acetylglucosaminyltransferase [Saprospiraceae bacterium]
MSQQLRILVSGGGTGGHIFPAVAIADALRRLRPDAEFLFVGANGRMEMERIPQAGYRIVGIDIAGLQRGFSWSSLRQNLALPFKLWRSWRAARRIVRDFRPDVAIGTGGYASWAALRVSQRLGVPTLIHEANSYAGIANRQLARRAQRVCVAYKGMERYFPAGRVVFTGNPVRADLVGAAAKRAEGLAFYGLAEGRKTLAVVGGSLGARTLNEAMAQGADRLAQRPDVQVLWQCGRYYETHYRDCATARLPNVQLRPFIERMDLLYAAADVVIARAGALTISELAVVGKPAILVPSPNVAEDHQTRNAQALAERNAALLVPDAQAAGRLLNEALALLDDPQRQAVLRENIQTFARPDAAEAIAREALRLCENDTQHDAQTS